MSEILGQLWDEFQRIVESKEMDDEEKDERIRQLNKQWNKEAYGGDPSALAD